MPALQTVLISVLVISTFGARAHDLPPPMWWGNKCGIIFENFCDTGLGFVYVQTAGVCEHGSENSLEYLRKKARALEAKFSGTKAYRWEYWMRRKDLNEPFVCDYAIWYR